MTEIPFSDRRSMRSIKNSFIQLAETQGHKDINTWIQELIEIQYREATMAKNIKTLQDKLIKYEKKEPEGDDKKVDEILKA